MWDDIVDWFSDLFEAATELSIAGVIGGVAAAVFIFLLRDRMLNPFLANMTTGAAIFWGAATYIGCFVGGYAIMNKVVND